MIRFMKNVKIIVTVLFTTVFLTSCEKFLDINTDPTLYADAKPSELLPTAQFFTGQANYNQARFAATMYAGQVGSVLGIAGEDAYYESENSGGWTSFYINVLPQLNTILKQGQSQSIPAYTGVAKVLLAYNLGTATTQWENIPFSQADLLNFSPEYDSQEVVYQNIQKLLDEAITELGQTSAVKPAADDLIYGGDLSKWTRAAYTLKARYALHLSRKNPQTAAQTALTAVALGFKENADDFDMRYNTKNLSPWYSNIALPNNTGNISVTYASPLVDLYNGRIQGVVDPRTPLVFALRNNQTAYNGITPGLATGATVDIRTTAWHSNINSVLQLATYAEAKAIEAEARFILNGGNIQSTGTTAEAYAAYLELIRSNMKKVGVADAAIATFLSDAKIGVGAQNLTLKHILKEKYKAMMLNGDIWSDLRRYDYLDFPMPENVNPDLGPGRIQRNNYPSSELTRNRVNAEKNTKTANTPMWVFSN